MLEIYLEEIQGLISKWLWYLYSECKSAGIRQALRCVLIGFQGENQLKIIRI